VMSRPSAEMFRSTEDFATPADIPARRCSKHYSTRS
jgi:hypothetical protein